MVFRKDIPRVHLDETFEYLEFPMSTRYIKWTTFGINAYMQTNIITHIRILAFLDDIGLYLSKTTRGFLKDACVFKSSSYWESLGLSYAYPSFPIILAIFGIRNLLKRRSVSGSLGNCMKWKPCSALVHLRWCWRVILLLEGIRLTSWGW